MRSQKSAARSQNQSPDRKGGVKFPDSLADLLRGVVSGLELSLSSEQLWQLTTHFSLLLKWNEKINLTSIRKPEEIAKRHFEESLYLTKLLPQPGGLLVDVGSGAGFPGLPLKIVWPGVEMVLLEPNHKKATFLKEVIRSCGLGGIEVRAERLEDLPATQLAGRAALATMRAVAPTAAVLANLSRLLASGGRLALFVGEAALTALAARPGFAWQRPEPIPHSLRRVILTGCLRSSTQLPG